MTIGEKIRTLRTSSHITQNELASQLGVSTQAVSKWEQGTTAPDISLLADIAEFFSITTDELLGAGKYRTPSGYKNYRARLLAVYEEGGTEDDFHKAKKAYEDVIISGDANVEDYLMYGYLYNCRVRRDIEMAMRYYEKALVDGKETRGQRWFQTHQQITLLQCMMGKGDEVVERWKSWYGEEPENYQACLAVIWALYYSKRSAEALPYIEQAEKLAPNEDDVLLAIGDVLGGENGVGKYCEAIKYWKKAFEINDDHADALFAIAYAYEKLGEYEKAIDTHRYICQWLDEKGYDIGIESNFSEEKIIELKNMI